MAKPQKTAPQRTIYLETVGSRSGGFHDSLKAWIALGPHGVMNGTRLLSAECVSLVEVEQQAEALKKEIDWCVASAMAQFGGV